MRPTPILALIRAVMLAAAFALVAGTRSARAEPPVVVTDIPAVQSLVAQVMGEAGTPVLLLDQGADPHDFQLRPSQARALADARLVFWIGPELTPWLARALDAGGADGETVGLLAAEGTRLRGAGTHPDPHAWLDPANARLWTGIIAARLASADPERAALYAANAEAAETALDDLDAELRAVLAPASRVEIFVYHDAYGYFAEAYGLTIAGSLAEGDAADPGAARIATLRRAIAASPRPCVFAEAGHDARLVDALVEGTPLIPGRLDPEGTEVPPGPDHYAGTLRALATEVARCAAESG